MWSPSPLSLIDREVRKRWPWLLNEKKENMTAPRCGEDVYCRDKRDIDRSIWKGPNAARGGPGRVREKRGRDLEPRGQELGVAKMAGLIGKSRRGRGRTSPWSGDSMVGGRTCLPGCLYNR